MKTKPFFFFTLLFIFQITFSQVDNTKVFQLLDKETKQPIAFATIMLKSKNRGTHADTEGFFEIPLKYIRDYTIHITSIGYISKEIQLSKITFSSVTILYLEPANTVLDEVVIRSKKKKEKRILAYSIVKKAIANIPKNYPTKPYSYIGYYRDYQQPVNQEYKKFVNAKEDIDYINLHEGIIEVFDAGFGTNQLTNKQNQTVLRSFITNTDFRVDSTLTVPYDNESKKFSDNYKVTPLGGNELNLLNLVNAVRNYDKMSFSFANIFERDFLENHTFRVKKIQYLDGKTLYEINLKTKKTNFRNRYFASGKIYIDKERFAIYKLNYNLYYGNINNLQYAITTEFSEKNSKMFLNYITFNNQFIARSSNYFKVDKVKLNINSFAFKVEFNKDVNLETLKPFKRKFKATYKNKFLKIDRVTMLDSKTLMVYLDTSQVYILDNKNEKSFITDFNFEVRNIKDVFGYTINKKVNLKFNQYRELFVQELFTNKDLPLNTSFVNKMKPLSESKIESLNIADQYWINSPLKKGKKE
ncbi:carboxypeptidase-like regulatory domain-containing protein [Polaribacter marinivivus]|uniref:Carboxypeptidase-like regulatory domain-containing protein n=1 Tax=Polaribacter marinivivus TaxID=1524260 RepID=A0ABV8R6A4_9FLAO